MNHSPFITLTKEELNETVRSAVFLALETIGLKPSKLQNGKIYRKQMVEVIGRRDYEKAVTSGELKVNPGKYKNSAHWTTIADWQEYLDKKTNQQL